MSEIKSYRDLRVWNEGVDFAVMVYETTDHFPREEQFGLTSQLRRASVSIPSNVAEGQQRHSTPEYIRYCRIALGSTGEIDTQLEIAKRRNLLAEAKHDKLMDRLLGIRRMLGGLIGSLQRRSQETGRAREEALDYGVSDVEPFPESQILTPESEVRPSRSLNPES